MSKNHMTCVLLLLLMVSSASASQAHKLSASKVRQPICGYWQEDYIGLHQRILQGKQPPRYAVALSTHQGFSDRLLGIVATFYYALLNDRAFQISQGEYSHKMPLETVYSQPNINWTASMDYAEYVRHSRGQNRTTVEHSYVYHNILTFDLVWENPLLEQWNSSGPSEPEEVVLMMSNRGFSNGMFQNLYIDARLSELGLREDTAFGCAMSFLFELLPEVEELLSVEMAVLSQSSFLLRQRENECNSCLPVFSRQGQPVLSLVQNLAAEQGKLTIGIQIRLGDHAFANENVDWTTVEPFFSCAQQIEDDHKRLGQEAVWYVVSDSRTVRQLAQQHFGDKVLTKAQATVQHTANYEGRAAEGQEVLSLDGMRTAVGEHWLLGMTDFHVSPSMDKFFKFNIHR